MSSTALILILTISIITDLRSRKIFNVVTLPAILVALIFHSFTSGFQGLSFSGLGFLVGLGLLLIPFLLGGIGAGDVKLLAAIGAWKGMMFVLYTGLLAGVVGGFIALLILLKRKQLGFTLKNMVFSFVYLKGAKGSLQFTSDTQSVSIPYAIPIAVGAFLTLLREIYI
ncbi:prepilin peptidase [Lederbergia wuyishanensis]|uniref:Prepilin peptidase CpaA n=1 Tax=Lederbergia wuyishanensis TaxID=1347903 RepID=A0ABU0D8A2_9BACI|nr:prepilin peptidase [Lederbergia wuyishanensis]MCJ8009237.1 prepilin peptidase [Lederbergia wuyishanensis]MDQ0344630.1 prepilin peptidase CpaA [Lederbergia wuyishanensis]